MRIFRTVVTALVIALLGLGGLGVAPAGAEQSLPKRVITEDPPGEHQVSYNAFKLKGKVEEPQADGTVLPYAQRSVFIQKKACKTCAWRTTKKVKTDEVGTYKTRIFAPQQGRWKWRVKVKASSGYGTTKGTAWTLFFR